jgi:hypothetical protein
VRPAVRPASSKQSGRERAHELDPTKPFLTQRHRKRSIADLLDALKSDFEIRGIASKQNLSNIKRTRADFGMVRATALSPEAVDQYVEERLADVDAKASINRVLQLLKQAYTLAEFPAPKIRRLDESDNVRRGFFSEVEIRRGYGASAWRACRLHPLRLAYRDA